ncbi:hypothetical protein PAT3040_02204 [Paenibacillus agaridevorans]|uniref:Response receiver domain-containing protein n=1 Tax=Paenibacillus agaridevorans TaxID=171404 RepID=A0A2R5ERG9_9BACL|nr:response regulator receiver domain [Paenibacillus agaridevorans]GBG07648.1 hypothetical protein PAT3040_02204 [Paenibacillus agaridevorans]
MSIQEQIVGIVKRYFDNAVIVDDDLNLEEQSLPEITDEELVSVPDDLGLIEYATPASAKAELITREQPGLLFRELAKEGIVTYPYRYQRTADEIQLRWLSSILRNAKLLFLDWNLEEAKPESSSVAGTASLKIMEEYSKVRSGLKCAVIYTQADCIEVLDEIAPHFQIIDRENYFFQEKNAEEGNSLFGFVMNKEIQASDIMDRIGSILLKDKSISLHILDSVHRLEQSISNVMHRFNAPFEKIIFTQMVSSEIDSKDMPAFLDDTLLSDVLSEHSKISATNFLFRLKKREISESLKQQAINQQELEAIRNHIPYKKKELIESKLLDSTFTTRIIELLESDQLDSIDSLKSRILEVSANQMSLDSVRDIILILMLLDEFRRNTVGFKETFQKQTYYLTKLLKYFRTDRNLIDTGSIWKFKNQYMLCITPFCDTYRPEKVNFTYKFIVGNEIPPTEKLLDNKETNSAFISVPIEESKSLIFVKWDFYNVVSVDKDSVLKDMQKITTLKKEYVQNIINRYIGYQARAGVNELFYKESYRSHFVGLLS